MLESHFFRPLCPPDTLLFVEHEPVYTFGKNADKNHLLQSADKDVNYELAGNKTYIFDNSSLNLKVGSVKNETISARGNSTEEKDELKNYSANINYENFLNNNTRFYNTNYLRQTKAEYDDSSTNQNGYYGNNKMGSFQLGLENLDQLKKYNYVFYYNIYDR